MMYLKYEQTIKALAHDLFSNNEDAEDAVQEVSIKLLGMECPADNPDAWAYVVIRNALFDYMRRWKVRNKTAPTYSDEFIDFNDPYEYMAEKETAVSILENYRKLPDEIRDACFLRYQKGLSYDEIAERQGVPIGTVGSRISRGKEMLSLGG